MTGENNTFQRWNSRLLTDPSMKPWVFGVIVTAALITALVLIIIKGTAMPLLASLPILGPVLLGVHLSRRRRAERRRGGE